MTRLLATVLLLATCSGCMYPHPNLFKPDPDKMIKALGERKREVERRAAEETLHRALIDAMIEELLRPREPELIEGDVDQVG